MDTEAAAPEAPGPDPRHESDLYTRPGWVDAEIALGQLDRDKAIGDRGILWIRHLIQTQLRTLGTGLETHAGKFLFVSLLTIAMFIVGLKSATFHSDIELLWAEPSDVAESTPKEFLSTHQMVVQTGVDPDVDLLNLHGMLEHLRLVQKAAQVSVNMFETTWKLKDLCQSPSIPAIDAHYVEQMFENMMPCSIITPLDCFWEGSKLLGPDFPVYIPYGVGDQLKWTNLNPKMLVERMKTRESNFDYHSLENYLKRAGIMTAYQEKPCLDPSDPECPQTSPNYNSSKPIDVGAELTNGCHGFAARYMHWPEELIVGGTTKNKTGHIKTAKALQTVIQLMGENEFFEFWSGHYKVHHISWSKDRAAAVMNAWQKRFAQEVDRLSKAKISDSSSYSFITFSTANVNKILKEYSKTDFITIGAVLSVMAVYSAITQSLLGFIGFLALVSATAAALGFCSLMMLPMNILSTHVLPFVSIGLSMRDMFLMLNPHTRELPVAEILVRAGPTIISNTLISTIALLSTTVLPVPALRVFALQGAAIVLFHGAFFLIIFPCLLAIEQRCWNSNVPRTRKVGCSKTKTRADLHNNNDAEYAASLLYVKSICQQHKSYIGYFATKYLQSVLMKPFTKIVVCAMYAMLAIYFVYNAMNVKFDVKLSSFLPSHTQEYQYLEAQDEYFGFYNFYMTTTESEYPYNQPLLYEFHSSLANVQHVLKDSNGGVNLNNFWLESFREFLEDLQAEFDAGKEANIFSTEKWYPNATEKAVLAFKLMAQTGIVEFPVDKSQIFKKRLVHKGIIDPKAFYNYLSAWNANDQIAFSSSEAELTPRPFQYYSSKSEFDLKIPRSQPLTLAQMPFYLKGLRNSAGIISTMKEIKAISEEFNNRGLKNYPTGVIFAYFNQFLRLDQQIGLQILITLAATALVACLLIKWSKLSCCLVNVFVAFLPLTLMNVNAFTSIMGAIHFMIVSRNVLLITTGFLSAMGNRERRLKMSLDLYADCIVKGDVGLLISIVILAISNFEFIHNTLFMFLMVSIVTSFANSFIVYPTVLVGLGPKGELTPVEHDNRISTPPPPTPPPVQERPRVAFPTNFRRSNNHRSSRDISLSTITEESCNQSILVEPQVTVELSSPDSSTNGPFTTKVTATANIKVEVVTPMYRSSGTSKCHRTSSCSRKTHSRAKPVPTQHTCKCTNKDTDSSDSTAETEPCQSS